MKIFGVLAFLAFTNPAVANVTATDLADEILAVSPEQRKLEERRDGLEVYQHNLNYFISGEPDTKVQLSFKVKLIHGFDLYGAYTQTMFWDLLTQQSSPFSDLNYNPEGFYRWYMDHGMLKGLDFGFEHKSNGKAGPESRSFNRSYLTTRTAFRVGRVESEWNTKFYYLSSLDEEMPDARAWFGFVETSFILKGLAPEYLKDAQLYVTLNPGGFWKPMRGSREIGFRFRIPIKAFDPYLFMQIYSGYGESMLNYRVEHTSYRIGLSI